MRIGLFYAMIGALIRNTHSGKYLVLRKKKKKDVGAGAWECVTGRVDQGDGFPEALQWEVKELLNMPIEQLFCLCVASRTGTNWMI